jgi:hypothetical protein
MPSYVSAALTFLLTVLPVFCILLAGLAVEQDKLRLVIASIAGWVVFNTLLVGVWTYIGSTTPGCRDWLWLLVVGALALNVLAVWNEWKSSS